MKPRQHPFLFCVFGYSLSLFGLFGMGGCNLLGSSCSGGRKDGNGSSDGPCSDGNHYTACIGGEGFESDYETACPSASPLCIASNIPDHHDCVSQDELDCLAPEAAISGVKFQSADLNGDGLTDLAYLAGTTFTVALADGSAAFPAAKLTAAPATQFRLAHLTQRRGFDVAVVNDAGQLLLIQGASDGTFPPSQFRLLAEGVVTLLGAGDADGDGLDDLVVQTSNQSVTVLSSAQGFMPITVPLRAAKSFERAALADTDGDGANELLLSDNELNTDVYKEARATWSLSAQLQGQLLAAADLDGDGLADLLLNRASTLAVMLGRSDGSLVQTQEISGNGAIATDIDGDGAIDVVLVRNELLVQLRGRPDGTFEEHTPLNISTVTKEILALVTPQGTELLLASDSQSSRLSRACLAR